VQALAAWASRWMGLIPLQSSSPALLGLIHTRGRMHRFRRRRGGDGGEAEAGQRPGSGDGRRAQQA
jgi:hypothetical protein